MSKGRVKFILKEPTSTKETLIYLIYRDRFRFKYSIREKVKPDDWSFDDQRMKEIRGLPFRRFNNRLDQIEHSFSEIILTLKIEGRYTIDNITREMDFLFNVNKQMSLIEYLRHAVEKGREEGYYDRVKSIGSLANHLEKFQKDLGVQVDYHTINPAFASRFEKWMYHRVRKDKAGNELHYSKNYVSKMVKNITRMMKHAEGEGYHRSTTYQGIKTAEEDVYQVYLTTDDIRKLLSAELPEYLSNARDLFIIGCFTGLRVGNYLKIDPDLHIDRTGGYMYAISNKNGPRLTIPIHPEVEKILTRRGGMPRTIAETNLREYIKQACKIAGLTEKVIWVRTEGGKRVEHVNEKWEMVSTHTARRTFATNAYKAGITPKEIMQITGHRTEASFFKYIRITQEQAAERMKNHAFFKEF